MTDYGVQPTGYVAKPLSVILAELEAAMITQFGPGVIQTPQSPLGQLNGLTADLVAEIEERNLDIYQSYDPDQSEGSRLDILARIRLINRGGMSDQDLRRALTNEGEGRIDIQDISRAVAGIDGVTYSRVLINDTGEFKPDGVSGGIVSLAVIGGEDQDIASVLRQYVVPGVDTFGNTQVSTEVDGFCRSVSIIRPVDVEVDLTVKVRRINDGRGCPPPSLFSLASFLANAWLISRDNGTDVSFYSIRSLIEAEYGNVEVTSINASRDGIAQPDNQPAEISLFEIATLAVQVDDA
jgi:hypothetical protein